MTALTRVEGEMKQVRSGLKTEHDEIGRKLRSLHSLITAYSGRVSIADILPKLTPLFELFSLSAPSISNPIYRINKYSSVSIAPDSTNVQKIISKVKEELMSLLKNSPAGVQRIGTGNEGLTDQLEQLRNLVKMIKGLFDEREAHIAQMSNLVF